MIQLTETEAGRELMLSGKGFGFTKFIAGSGSGSGEIEIEKQTISNINTVYYKAGEEVVIDGYTVTPSYSSVEISAMLVGHDAEEDYELSELALIAEDEDGNEIVFGYGSDVTHKIPITREDYTTIALNAEFFINGTPTININNRSGVSLTQFLNHINKSVSGGTCHGLSYSEGDLSINGNQIGILNQTAFRAVTGITSIVDELPEIESYMEGWLVFDKTTNLLYRCSNSSWETVDSFDTRISNSSGSGGSVNERKPSTEYSLEDIVTVSSFKSYKYLECVVAGTSSSGNIINESNVGQLIYDGTVKWLVCDIRDASPVASIKYDYSVRPGWVKCNGAVLGGNGYPRLLNYLKNHLATTFNYASLDDATEYARRQQNNNPGRFFLAHGTTLDAYNIILPDLTGRFIEGADTAGTVVDAGLPNITGYAEADAYGAGGVLTSSNGVFSLSNNYQVYAIRVDTEAPQNNTYRGLNFSASNSNSIYGRSTTVQPPAIQMIPLIKY